MAGWLAAMLVMAIAGRETTRELDVFQIMEMRSVIGLVMLYPLIHMDGGLGKLRTARPWPMTVTVRAERSSAKGLPNSGTSSVRAVRTVSRR